MYFNKTRQARSPLISMHVDLNILSEAELIYLLLGLSLTSLCQSVSQRCRQHTQAHWPDAD